MKKILLTALVLAGFTATAQVKVGSNPTTLATNANLQVEADDASQFFINKTNGNVGIGTLTPNYSLTLEGNSSEQIIHDFGISLKNESGHNVVTLLAYSNVNWQGNFLISQRSRGTFTSPLKLNNNDIIARIDAHSYDGEKFKRSAYIDFLSHNTAKDSVPTSIIFATTETITPATKMIISHKGDVGIGTTTPATRLHITDERNNAPGAGMHGSFRIGSIHSGISMGGIGATGTRYTWIQAIHSSATNTYPLCLNPVGGNVGIGTTAPTAKLHITNGSIIGGYLNGVTDSDYGTLSGRNVYGLLGTRNLDGTSGLGGYGMVYDSGFESPIIFANNQANNKIIFGSISPTDRNLSTGLLPLMVINSDNGNVGIGTTAPAAKLEVNGRIKVGDDTTTAVNGMIRYNSTTNKFQGYANGAWVDLH